MKKKGAVWRVVKDSLQRNVPVTLLYVLQSSGSSPGRQGFLMAVRSDGRMEGSIGGGMMEHKLVEKAKNKMQLALSTGQKTKTANEKATNKPQEGEIIKQVHDKAATKNQSGMICSGEQTVWLYPVPQKDAEAVNQIIACLTGLQNATLHLSPKGILFTKTACVDAFSFLYQHDGDWVYKERLGYQNRLYIVGGGHCSLALSGLMTTLDFYVHVFDDRNDLPTVKRNGAAHQKKAVTDYSELSSLIPEGQNVYVVIMTFGYRTDDVAVRALWNKEFKYIGLLGSKSKIQKMFRTYRDEGIEEKMLQRIHAPVGLFIKSETPEEIAVSIAAQIISIKNK